MFDHLDDPRPPAPGATLAERLQAEGARRRRRRSRALGGAALGVAVLVTAVAVRPWDDGDAEPTVFVGSTTTSTTEPSTTTAPDATTTTTDATTTTEAVSPPASAWPADSYVGITASGELVVGDGDSGDVIEVVAELGEPFGRDVARAPDGSAVYTAGSTQGLVRYAFGGEPERIGSAFRVAVSPDSRRLATISDGADDFGLIRILDAATGEVLEEVSFAEATGEADLTPSDVTWLADDRLLVAANLPEAGNQLFTVEPDGGVRRLGPPAGLAPGSGWDLGGPAGDGTALVLQTCCALDANSYNGDQQVLLLDTVTGEVLRRDSLGSADDTGGYVLDAGPDGRFLAMVPAYDGVTPRSLVGNADDLSATVGVSRPPLVVVDW